MALPAIAWLMAAIAVFIGGAAALRSYAGTDWLPMLLLSLALYAVGNLMMVQPMRSGGMAVAISVSAVLQLVMVNLLALTVFGERPGPFQSAGIVLGILAVALILWAPGARQG